MSGTVFFSFVLFLGSQLDVESYSIPVTEGAKNSFSSSTKHLDEDLTELIDEILLQMFLNNLNGISKSPGTAGRLITWRDMNETRLHPNSFNRSESASSSDEQEEHLAKIFDEILQQVSPNDPGHLPKDDTKTTDEPVTWRDANKNHISEKNESSLFNRDVRYQLTTGDKEIVRRLVTRDADLMLLPSPAPPSLTVIPSDDILSTPSLTIESNPPDPYGRRRELTPDASIENLPCRNLLSFLQKNIIVATSAMAIILLVTVLVVLTVATYLRRKQPRCPPASTTYNIFIMNGKAWWQKSREKHLKKFSGNQKILHCNSSI